MFQQQILLREQKRFDNEVQQEKVTKTEDHVFELNQQAPEYVRDKDNHLYQRQQP